MPRLIAITGLAGSGKSEVAKFLQSQHGFKLLKFADTLKEMLKVMGLSIEDLENPAKKGLPHRLLGGKSPRYAMQTLGTEWGRVLIHENLWAEIWKKKARQILLDGSPVICDDCRFLNEVEMVRDLGGEIWAIRRRGGNGIGSHASESGVAMRYSDWNISNNSTIEDLHFLIQGRIA